MKITVIGGTGLVGRQLVERLRNQGHEVIAAARSTGVNIVTGEGLAEAIEGARIVIDASNSGYARADDMTHFFADAGRRLLRAEREAGVAHHVALSAIGTNRLNGGYFAAKKAQEELVRDSGLGFTIVRSTPFFEFIYKIVDAGGEGDRVRVPPIQMRPIGSADVAAALAEIALELPASGVVEVVGPDQRALPDLALQILTANEDPRGIVVDPEALYFEARFEGEPLVGGEQPHKAPIDFESWLRAWIASA